MGVHDIPDEVATDQRGRVLQGFPVPQERLVGYPRVPMLAPGVPGRTAMSRRRELPSDAAHAPLPQDAGFALQWLEGFPAGGNCTPAGGSDRPARIGSSAGPCIR
jgi:hypothetical protein